VKLVYTHPTNIMVAQARSALEHAGIRCVLRNEYAAGAMGELAPIDVWPELWLLRDRDYDRARLLLEHAEKEVQEADWHCSHCGSVSPATFDLCWHCAGERPAG
jgi:hypothetical protein